MTNCPNCAAPLEGYKCRFCGTEVVNLSDFTPGKIAFIKIQNHILRIRATTCSVNMSIDAFPEFDFGGIVLEERIEE